MAPWVGAHLWRAGGEDFEIAGRGEAKALAVTLKRLPMSFELLKSEPGLRPAPYLASRGMKWIQRAGRESMDETTLKAYLRESWRLASLNLPRKRQADLGLNAG